MKPLLSALLSITFIAGFLFPAQPISLNPEALNPTGYAGAIVLVAGNTIDLKWDSTTYPGIEPFVRWELYRSPDDNSHYAKIRSGYDLSTDDYRDSGLPLDTLYYYQLRVVRCSSPCPGNEKTYVAFSANARSGELWGTVYKNLTMSTGTSLHTGALKVPKDMVFTIQEGTILEGSGKLLRAEGGTLQINGGQFNNSIAIEFGIPGDVNSTGGGWVRGAYFWESSGSTITIAGKKRNLDITSCTHPDVRAYGENTVTMNKNIGARLSLYDKAYANAQTTQFTVAYLYGESSALFSNNTFVDLIQYGNSNATVLNNQDGEIMLYEQANLVIHNNPKLRYIFMNDDSTADIRGNTIDEYIRLEERARAVIEKNTVRTNITVIGDGTWAEIVDNTIQTTSRSNGGIRVFDRSNTYIANNRLQYLSFHGTESAVLLLVVGKGAVSTVYGNTLTNCKMAFFDEAEVTVTENIVEFGGSAIIVGSAFGSHEIEATGSIERNTLTQGWGFELWGGSHAVTYKHNCIQGNTPGVTGADNLDPPWPMPARVDMTQNWWNHASGPTHKTNPGGLGDRIDSNMVDFKPVDPTGATCRTAPPPLQPDLRFMGGEAVQVVQTLDDSVPLVAKKPTLLRIYPENRAGPLANVPWELTALRDGSPIGQRSGTVTTYPIGDLDNMRANRQAGIEITLPPDWLTGTIQLFVELNPSQSIQETNYDNNSLTKTLVFTERNKLRVGLVPITYAPEGLPAQTVNLSALSGLIDPIKGLFPLAEASPVIVLPDYRWKKLMRGADPEEQASNGLELLKELELVMVQYNKSQPADQKIDQILGVFPGLATEAIDNCLSRPRWSKIPGLPDGAGIASYCITRPYVIAHEIGHNLGLRHTTVSLDPNCIQEDPDSYWSKYYSDDAIQEFGYNVLTDQIVPKTAKDLMSKCYPRWLSPLHYQKLYEANSVPQESTRQALQADQAFLLVGGSVTQAGQVTFDPFWQVTASADPLNTPVGLDYCVETRDAADALLNSRCFGLDFFEYESQLSLDMDQFLVSLPYSASVRKVVLTHAGQDLGSVQASAIAPTVTVTSPNSGGSFSGSLSIAWTAQDGDSGTLYYNLYYSRDAGASWLPLVTNLSDATSYTVDMSLMAGCTSCLVKVEASDGFNLGSDVSDTTFSLADNPPLVQIDRPIDGSLWLSPAMVNGYALDPEDGPLSGASLAWSSSLDGVLGSGSPLLASLTEGQHILTLTASDSAGHTRSASITIQVVHSMAVYLPVAIRK